MDPFFIRNLTYGLEDSLISTTGLLAGITFAGMPNNYVVIAGVILILIEALSMGFGSMISEESFLITSKSKYTMGQVLFYAITMFISYVVAGIVVLIPYILNLKHNYAYSIGTAIALLFFLVYAMQKNVFKALLLTFVGSIILGIMIIVGRFLDKKGRNGKRVMKS